MDDREYFDFMLERTFESAQRDYETEPEEDEIDMIAVFVTRQQLYMLGSSLSDMIHNLCVTYEEWTGSEDQKIAIKDRIEDYRQLRKLIECHIEAIERR